MVTGVVGLNIASVKQKERLAGDMPTAIAASRTLKSTSTATERNSCQRGMFVFS